MHSALAALMPTPLLRHLPLPRRVRRPSAKQTETWSRSAVTLAARRTSPAHSNAPKTESTPSAKNSTPLRHRSTAWATKAARAPMPEGQTRRKRRRRRPKTTLPPKAAARARLSLAPSALMSALIGVPGKAQSLRLHQPCKTRSRNSTYQPLRRWRNTCRATTILRTSVRVETARFVRTVWSGAMPALIDTPSRTRRKLG